MTAPQCEPGRPTLTFLIESIEVRAGMERVTVTVANALAARGFDVEILAVRGQASGFPVHERVRFTSLGFSGLELKMRSQTLPIMRAVRAHAQRHRPDVFVAVDTFMSIFAFPALLGLRTRRMAWEHQHLHLDFGMRSRRLARSVAAFLARDVAVLTDTDAEQWRRAFPRMTARLHVMPNPLPFPQPDSNPYSPQSTTVLAVGRLHYQKGFDLLLDAWSVVEPDFPGWSLKIVGGGPEHGPLRRQIARLGLRRAALAEPTAQVEREYRAAGLYVLSSRYEGLPMVLIESQAYGVPAVAFDCPTGPAEMLGSGGGLLVEAGNVSAMAATLRRALLDENLRRQMSEHAYRSVGRYDPQAILTRWEELLAPRR